MISATQWILAVLYVAFAAYAFSGHMTKNPALKHRALAIGAVIWLIAAVTVS